MKRETISLLALLCMILVVLAQRPTLPAAASSLFDDEYEYTLFTKWGHQHHDFVDDGESIWIATDGSLIRWDKDSDHYDRLSILDGLPHYQFYSVAVDGLGNLWVGGDNGLSRLDEDGMWTHFNTDNCGLLLDQVDKVVAYLDGTIWLAYHDSERISRRDPDGSWSWHPNIAAAVVADFGRIVDQQGATHLWTVRATEVWLGFNVFDGSTWQINRPDSSIGDPIAMVVSSNGTLYTAEDSHDTDIHVWVDDAWGTYELVGGCGFDHDAVATMTVTPQDEVWFSWDTAGNRCYETGLTLLPAEPGPVMLEGSTEEKLELLLADDEGVWGTGPAILYRADTQAMYKFSDLPESIANQVFSHSERDTDVWVSTGRLYYGGIQLQHLKDQKSSGLADDEWSVENINVQAVAMGPDGSVWKVFAGGTSSYPGLTEPPERWIEGESFAYDSSSISWHDFYITDIFALDEEHVVFAYSSGGYPVEWGAIRLHDPGTPADTSDDSWQILPFGTNAENIREVVLDHFGRIWLGGDSGLYRHDGTVWETLTTDYAVCAMTAAPDGTVLLQRDTITLRDCEYFYRDEVLVYSPDAPDNTYQILDWDEMLFTHPDLPRSAQPMNHLWTVAPDGSVWTHEFDWQNGGRLVRNRDGSMSTESYELPATINNRPTSLTADSAGRIWFVADERLWRFSAEPGFTVSAVSPVFLDRGADRSTLIYLNDIEGYTEPVTITIEAVPASVIPSWESATLLPDDSIRLTFTTLADVPLGTYTWQLSAASDDLSDEWSGILLISEDVHDSYLPFLSGHAVSFVREGTLSD